MTEQRRNFKADLDAIEANIMAGDMSAHQVFTMMRQMVDARSRPGPEMPHIAPWNDFHGKEIHEGDLIRHPTGEVGRVVFDETLTSDPWRVDYDDGVLSRLQLQVGDKGQAVVCRRFSPNEQEILALLEDAERYRWLRERDENEIHRGGVFAGKTPENLVISGPSLDAYIDAARQRARKGSNHA